MAKKIVNSLVLLMNRGVSWESWDEKSRRALAGSLSPMIGVSSEQKGASKDQWETVRVMRHLFGTGKLPLPSFVIKQWLAIPDVDKQYWASVGHIARPLILSKADRKHMREILSHVQ